MLIRVAADVTSRETLVTLVVQSWKKRGAPPLVAKQPYRGYYYIEIAHKGAAGTLRALLTEIVIAHDVVGKMPDGKTLAKPSSGPLSGHILDDPRVRAAAVEFIVETLSPRDKKNPLDL